METVRRRWIVGLVAGLWMLPGSAGASSRILVPGIEFSGEDTKINVPMSLIVDVMLEPGPYTDGPEPRDIMRKYQQDRNGKYDDRILPHLDEKDLAAIDRYVRWLKSRPESQVGSASQSSGQALFVPEGVSLVLRPNLAQYRGIIAVYGTLGGGPPYMPGVFVPGEGWSIPFSARDIRPGTRAVMVIAIDHSNQKKARVMWFDLWNRSGEGRQYGPYEIHVTQAIDQHHRPFRVQGMDPVDVALNYCRGLAPAVTLVASDSSPAALAQGLPVGGEPPPGEHLAVSEGARPAPLSPEQEVTVRLWDEHGDPLQQELPVDIYSLDDHGSATGTSLSVLGPTTARVRRGSDYTVALPTGFTLDPAPGDRTVNFHGGPVVVRGGNENGPVPFDFRRRPVVSRVLGVRQPVAPASSLLPSRRVLSSIPSPTPTREVVVRVSPAALGSRQVPIIWVDGGKAVRRSVLRPGFTTVVERFSEPSHVIPKAESSRWRISMLPGPGRETQYVALPQRGGR